MEGRNNAGRAILSPTQRGQFVVPTIRVVIEDAESKLIVPTSRTTGVVNMLGYCMMHIPFSNQLAKCA